LLLDIFVEKNIRELGVMGHGSFIIADGRAVAATVLIENDTRTRMSDARFERQAASLHPIL
jgi:hypothetical protein